MRTFFIISLPLLGLHYSIRYLIVHE